MPENIPRPIVRPVQLRAQARTAVPDRDLHRVRDRALGLPRHVDGGPRQRQRGCWVDASRGEEGAEVRDTRSRDGILVGEQDGVADGAKDRAAGDEGGALVEALREDGDGEGGQEGEGVGRDGEELRGGGFVAEGLDDAWLSAVSIFAGRTQAFWAGSSNLQRRERMYTAASLSYEMRSRTASTLDP